MQPTTPFNTTNWTVRVSEVVGGLSLVIFLYFKRWQGLSTPAAIAFTVAVIGYAFIRSCSLVRWHPRAERGEGLEQQFIQVGVAARYGLAIAAIAAVAHLGFLIYPIAIVLAGVSAINATLLCIHARDQSTVPVNFFSHHKINEEES